MSETFVGVFGLLLITVGPIVIAFLLFRRTPLGSGDIYIASRNFIILLAIVGGPGVLIAVGLLFKINTLAVIGVLIYVIPLVIGMLFDRIHTVSTIFKFIDLLIPNGRDENRSEK